MSFFFFLPPPPPPPPPPPTSTFVCFPVLAFGLLFVSYHVGLYLIIVLLFLCQQFIPLPCHLIMCCVNSVLLRASSFFCGLTVLSGLLTCVDVCSVAGITAQVNTLHLGLWGGGTVLRGPGTGRYFCLSICVADVASVSCPVTLSLFSHFAQLVQNNTFCPSSLVFLSRSPTGCVYSPALLCSRLSIIVICRTLLTLSRPQSGQSKIFVLLLPCLTFV